MSRTMKEDLHRYLQAGRDAVVWKLDGLSDYDARRPLVPTGTNLLGLVKHLAGVELGYFGLAFGRPSDLAIPRGDEPNSDMYATADESRDHIVGLYRAAWEHADATIDELDLESVAEVPWWGPEHRITTLHRLLVHVATETHRHAGHADIVRELIDGSVGLRPGATNVPSVDERWWRVYRERVQAAADAHREG